MVARATGARIVLATVIPTVATASGDLAVSATFSPTATGAFLDLAEADALAYLNRITASVKASGTDVQSSVTRGKPATQLAAIMEMTDRDGYQKPLEGEGAGGPTDEAHLRVDEGSQS